MLMSREVTRIACCKDSTYCNESQHVTLDEAAKLYRVHITVDERRVYLGTSRMIASSLASR